VISVVIPVKNGGSDLVRCLDAIARQKVDEEVEVVVVDSGSTDGSPRRALERGARVIEIPPERFSHGGARTLGAAEARGEVLVFTTQDAYADDEHWLSHLVAPLADENVGGVYGRQLPHADANPSERYFLTFLYGPEPRTQRLHDPSRLSFHSTLFSNVNSAIPRVVLDRYPLADDVLMSEDQEWSRRVLLGGRDIVYEPRAAVRHSHAYTVKSAFRRFFDSGASAGRSFVSEASESRAALRRAGLRYALGELDWLWRTRQLRWLPYAVVYESAKFAGLQLGLRHEHLPTGLKKRMSSLPTLWDDAPADDEPSGSGALRICLVYDHIYPQTVGGAERWMRDLGLHLARAGHSVTHVTMRHWTGDHAPAPGEVRVVAVTDAGRVYSEERRTLLPPIRFGLGVARYLWRHGDEYDVVHVASFPYFPLLAASAVRRRGGYRLVVDWIEVWTKAYWRQYAGVAIGTAGWLVQRACVRLPHDAYCISRMHADRLLAEGYDGTPVVLPGLYAGPEEVTAAPEVDPLLVVYAGRHVREKRLDLLIRAFALARARVPGLRLELFGEGPEDGRIEDLIRRTRLNGAVQLLGKRPEDEVDAAIARSACLATASEREGYGLVVVEAAAHGTPSVIVAGPENAAVELVTDDVNGIVAPRATAESLADAIVRAVEAGGELRASTSRWFAENAARLRIGASLELVAQAHGGARSARLPEVTTPADE
jgi:glycosyltransferase involved in cell wall biosynthesis